ncbi:restriction endonuclease subunit S [Nocardia sp. NPDC003183]
MAEWDFVAYHTLASRDRSSFSMGPFGSKITKDNYVASGVPVIRGVNLTRGVFLDCDFVFITDEKADDIRAANVEPGDLIFTHRGTIGQVSMVTRSPKFHRYVIGSSQVKTRLDETKALPEFYYYWFQSTEGQRSILANASTVGVPGIATPLTSIRNLKVPHPPLSEQRSVASVLMALDDKIAVNERIAATTLDLAHARFQQSNLSTEGTVPMGDLIELKYGKSLPATNRIAGDYSVFGSGGVSGTHNEFLVKGPGIIVGRKGTVGSVYWSEESFFPIDTTFYAVCRDGNVSLEYAYFALQSLGLEHMNSDSAIPGLNRDRAYSVPMKLPSPEAVREFTSEVRALFALQRSREQESHTLGILRDTLLPHLMSGRLRVKDAEKIIEDHA